MGGSGSGSTGGDGCAGVWFFCRTSQGCGYAIGIGRIFDACMVGTCQIDTPQPCGYT